jgi:ATP-dependent helicase/nuclease subunit A
MRLSIGEQIGLDLEAIEPPLTAAQRRAMALDRELVISAGAGAGKTQTLSLRYVALLLRLAVEAVERDDDRRADVERVLVLTFTEKAAGEMADRCYRRLLELSHAARDQARELQEARGPGYAEALAAQLDHLLDTFDAARISTFHAFCARLLREFPAETGAPTGFEVLEPMEAARVQGEVVERVLSDFTRAKPALIRALLDAFGSRRWLLEALSQAVRERAVLEAVLRTHQRGVTLHQLMADLPISEEEVGAWIAGEGGEVIAELLALTAPSGGGRVRAALAPVGERMARRPEDPITRFALYREALELLMTGQPPQLRKLDHYEIIGKADRWADKKQYKAAKEALKALAERCEGWPRRARQARGLPTEADRVLPRYLGTFAEVALAAIDELRGRYLRMAVTDFDDMQAQAVAAVLRDEGLRRQLQARHRYLMVDEFQDTDAAQWALVRGLGRPEDAPEDRIFLVGDVKQAIYSFRGGDVTVFRKAARELAVAPTVLPDNFRSRDELIGWFNTFFSATLGLSAEGRPEWEAHYEPLEQGRGEAGGSVTLLTHREDQGARSNALEAEAVVKLIACQALRGEGLFADLDLRDTEAYPAPPIAILLRARTHMLVYEQTLRAAGVPFVVARGVGFWEREEVIDLVNLLHALSTGDPISIAGALRSPLFCVDDQTLHDLVSGLYGVNSLGAFGRRPLTAAAPPSLHEADRRWRALLELRDRALPSELLRRALDLCAAWHIYALSDPEGQAEANAVRLVELVGRLERRLARRMDAVARYLHRQVVERARESEAVLSPGDARVVLMTVHASKGLEFPVVFVPDLGFATQGRPTPLTIRRLGGAWAMAFQVPDPVAAVRRRTRPGRLLRLEQMERDEELAEHKRLFYVAATRARDHLVLLGRASSRPSPDPRTWMQLIEAHHGAPPASGDGLEVWPIARALELELPPPPPAPPPPAPHADAARRTAPLPAPGALEIDDGELDLFAACPARWYRRALLAIPEPGWRPSRPLSDHPALAAVAGAPGRAGVRYRRRWAGVVVRGAIDRLYFDEAAGRWELLSLARGDDDGPLGLLARARAATEVLAANEQPPVARARLLNADGSHTPLEDPPARFEALERALEALAGAAGAPWVAVERAAARGPLPRPCATCGYQGRGCEGRIDVEPL